jgi:hypothetical protein
LPWREWVLQAAALERALWADHPELYEASNYRAISRPSFGMLEVGLEVLGKAGFTPLDAICGLAAVFELAHAVGWSESQLDRLSTLEVAEAAVQMKAAADVTISLETLFERTTTFALDGMELTLKARGKGTGRGKRATSG